MTRPGGIVADVNEKRRRILDALLKATDVAVALSAVVGGVFTFVATPPTVLREVSIPFLIILWGCLLLLGGLAGLVGRLSGIWIIETTGLAAMAAGALIYLVVVSSAIPSELGVVVAVSLIAAAMFSMMRRYIELQIFTAIPTEPGLINRLRAIWGVRTPLPRILPARR